MKKLYTLLLVVLITTISYAQTYNAFTGNGTDDLWDTPENWNNSTLPTTGNTIDIYNNPENIDFNVVDTYKYIQNVATRILDVTISGVVTDPPHELVIDNGNTNSNWAGNTAAYGIRHLTTSKQTLTIDCNISFNNTANGFTVLRNDGHVENTIELGPNSVLNLIGNGNGATWSNSNVATRKFNFNGKIKGAKNFVFGDGETTFGATSQNPDFDGVFTFADNANVTVNTLEGNIWLKNAGKIQANGNNATLNITNAFVINGTQIQVGDATKDRVFNMNINANQNLRTFTMAGTSTVNINLGDNVSRLLFYTNNVAVWGSSTLNFTNFREGVVQFGSDNTALNNGLKLSQITHDGSGGALALDANGYLVYASTLSVKDHTAFDFSIYPNPVKEVLNINTKEALEKIEVADLLGRIVLKQENVSKSVDLSSLNKGVYILKLTSEKGISTKKIIKE